MNTRIHLPLRILNKILLSGGLISCLIFYINPLALHAQRLSDQSIDSMYQAQIHPDEKEILQSEELQGIENNQKESALENRIKMEEETKSNPFVITPYRPNYVLIGAYNPSPNSAPFEGILSPDEVDFDNVELKFQISLRFPILTGIYEGKGSLIAAYTQRSFWQAYNIENSSPFRETNYEPELFLSFKPDLELFGYKTVFLNTGYNHHSNGQAGNLSRSWNRLFVDLIFENKNRHFYFNIRPWLVVGDLEENPDIKNYMGYMEILGIYKYNKQTVSLMLRKKAIQLDWSFPLFNRARWYIQYFDGYGESLIDYNHYTQSLGVGFQFTDWL